MKARATILAKNPNHYKEVGALGGLKSKGGGFAVDVPCDCKLIEEPHKLSQCAGSIGGRKSRRGKANG